MMNNIEIERTFAALQESIESKQRHMQQGRMPVISPFVPFQFNHAVVRGAAVAGEWIN